MLNTIGRTSLIAQSIKNLTAMQETWVQFLGWEDTLEKEMATHSSILSWRIPWTEETGRLQSMGLQGSNMTQQLNHQPRPLSSYGLPSLQWTSDNLLSPDCITCSNGSSILNYPKDFIFSLLSVSHFVGSNLNP